MSNRIRTEPSNRRVRAIVGGRVIADTVHPLLVWEIPYFPTYYFPAADVAEDLLVDGGDTRRSPSRGTATVFDVKVDEINRIGAAYAYGEPKVEELADHYAFDWDSIDHWFEEDEEVFVHARDPYTRVDILHSSRSVRVEVDGVTVAETNRALFLFETGLPVRYYLPKTDVRLDLLTPTETESHCPYKGTARYWSVTVDGTVHEDIVWGYDFPTAESQKIAGLVSFYNEKVDVYVDGEPQERPHTKFG